MNFDLTRLSTVNIYLYDMCLTLKFMKYRKEIFVSVITHGCSLFIIGRYFQASCVNWNNVRRRRKR